MGRSDGVPAMKRILVYCAMLACASPAAHRAHAHGEYDWIKRGGYRNQSGEICCGRDDCSIVTRARIRAGGDGFILLGRGLSVPRSDALPSEDGKFWLCAHPDGRVRCFFAPPEM